MANITVIGTGYVGLVSGSCLADFGNTVVCVDTDTEKINNLKNGIIPIYEPGLADVIERNTNSRRLSFTTDFTTAVQNSSVLFIAVGTPSAENGSADLRCVEEAARSIGKALNSYSAIVNKSTVPIGTARKVQNWIEEELALRKQQIPFDVVSNPEFLREGTAVYDFTHPDRIVIGAESKKACELMKDVYRSLYLNETPYIETNLESAEMIKYACNAFLAVKISYINEIANLCEKTGADVQVVAKAMGKDGRIGPKFLHPGPGYGGSCFPKDTRAIAKTGLENGIPLSLVESAITANENQKRKMVEKIESCMGGSLEGKTISILGLAFKHNTDDIREAPSISICTSLMQRGARLRIHDPVVKKEALFMFKNMNNSFYFAVNEYDATIGSDALVIVTEWHQFRNMDLLKIKQSMKESPYFFDLRNIYNRAEVEKTGFRYWGVGR